MIKEGAVFKRIGALLHGTHATQTEIFDELMRMPGLLVVVTNAQFELLTANDYFYAFFHCEPSLLAGKSLCHFLGEDVYNEMSPAHVARVLAEGHVWNHEARTLLPDGEGITLCWNQCVLPNRYGQPEILSVGFLPTNKLPQPTVNGSTFEVDAPPLFFNANRPSLEAVNELLITEDDIRQALKERGFMLFYQPNIQARNKKIVGAEALLRMRHPVYGVVPPIVFIPTAEQTGQIIEIGEFVMETACKKIKRWTDNGCDLFLSVNISTQQFMHETFTQTLLSAITKHDVAAGRLMLEITEDTASRDITTVRNILQKLRGMGSRISLDDYGVGFTSLRHLEMLEIDNLKIDRFFLASALRSKRFFGIVESIIVLAHGLGMSVTAEGIEAQTQFDYLVDKSCDYLQGYLLSHPLPEPEFERLLFDSPDFYFRNLKG